MRPENLHSFLKFWFYDSTSSVAKWLWVFKSINQIYSYLFEFNDVQYIQHWFCQLTLDLK